MSAAFPASNEATLTKLQASLRPRLLGAILAGAILFALLPAAWPVNSRLLVAWDAGVVLYLALAWTMAARSTTAQMQRRASLEDEGAVAILCLTLAAAVASLASIAVELHGIRQEAGAQQVFQAAIAGITIICSWFFVHTIFAIHYAHEYYGDGERRGLTFPQDDKPDYWDFLYFAFNLGAAAQTSDVVVVSKRMRRLTLAHTILAFLFNAMILALAVNAAAGLI